MNSREIMTLQAMPSANESQFNLEVADILIPEYNRKTGQDLKLNDCTREFPDIVCTLNGKEVGIELVEVGLFFVNQENSRLRQYEERFANEVFPGLRPRYKNFSIWLQIALSVVNQRRPHSFPDAKRPEADRLVSEFAELLREHEHDLLLKLGCHLRTLQPDPETRFATLLRYFDAIILNRIEDSYPGRLHPDDPVIELRRTNQLRGEEIAIAVENAIEKKNRGVFYSTDLLVLHTRERAGKPYYRGPECLMSRLCLSGRNISSRLGNRFKEVWFLNAYYDANKNRLHRLFPE